MAERRARRAEMAEESMADRVRGAEELADRLRDRTDELERELVGATRERDELLGRLSARERTLLSLQQREESERRRRLEVEVEGDADRRRLEQEISDLRVRVGAAEAATAELADELTRTRDELDTTRQELERERAAVQQLQAGSADRVALTQALESRREEMAAEVSALRAQAGGLAERLGVEERERAEAQSVLVAERERAAAQITLLEHELDRRAHIHDAVLGQLRGLGGEVARIRDGVAHDAERRALTEQTLSDVAVTARRLRGELAQLEQDRDATAAELQVAREALVQRDADLAGARAALATVRAESESVAAATARQAGALADAERSLAETLQSLAESQQLLGESQLERAGAQHTLNELQQAAATREQTLVEARAAADGLLVQVQNHRDDRAELVQQAAAATARADAAVAERQDALAAQQQGFTEQLQRFEGTVSELRGRLTAASQEFDRRLGEERTARQAAEQALIAQDEAFAGEREGQAAARAQLATAHAALTTELAQAHDTIRAEGERADTAEARAAAVGADRDRLAAEIARRDALDDHVRETLMSLRVELSDLRVQSDARDAREAAVERLVTDLVDTARELREGFDRELVEVRGEMERRGQADLKAADDRLELMRLHLESSVDQLHDELEVEQRARRAAERSLDEERDRVEVAGLAAVDAAVDRDELARELQTRLAAEVDARTALAAAEQELTLLRRTPAPSQEDALAVVESLTRAARRLREESELAEEASVPAGSEAEAATDAETDTEIDADTERRADAEPDPDAAPDADAQPDADADPEPVRAEAAPVQAKPVKPAAPVRVLTAAQVAAAARAEALRTQAIPVRPRVVALEGRPVSTWMTPALQRFAAEEPDVAAAALVTLLPALGLVSTRELRCDVTVRGRGTWRVAMEPGTATVATLTRSSGDPDVTIVGDIDALAPLVAGGAQRRLPGVDVIGRRRKLRRLLKERRSPVALADLHAASITPSGGVLLGLLSRGVAGAWVAGSHVVDFAVSGPFGGTWRVSTTPGETPVVTVPDEDSAAPGATVHVADVSILALLAAVPLPPGERLLIGGDVDAANAVTGLFSRAQGLTAVVA